MIIKPAVNFLNVASDADLAAGASTVLASMTGNANFPNPSPTLSAVSAALTAFTQALDDAADGGKTLTAAKNARRAELVALLRQLAAYVGSACAGDRTALLTSGFPTHKPARLPIGSLSAPVIPTLTQGLLSGTCGAVTTRITGAAVYTWRLSLASAPDVYLQISQTTGARTSFAGLTPGTLYNVDVNAVGTAGPSDWSNPAQMMVI